MALVRRGKWKAAARVEAPREAPTFHEFATEWFARQVAEGGRNGNDPRAGRRVRARAAERREGTAQEAPNSTLGGKTPKYY